MRISAEEQEDLRTRCLAFLKECPADIANNKKFWDKEVDYLINALFRILMEEKKSNDKETNT